MSTSIALYKQLTPKLIDEAKFEISLPTLGFINSMNEETTIDLDDSYNYNVNDISPEWSPVENNLTVRQQFIISNPSVLFGEDGLTSELNKLAISVKIYSRLSNFSRNIKLDSFSRDDKHVIIDYEENFNPNSLRGTIFFEFSLITSEVNESLLFQADQVGMQLTSAPLIAYTFNVDGDGSEFPIEENHEPGKGLWKVWMNWIDVYSDSFDSTSVKLILNNAHPLYESLFISNRRINSYLMNDIIVSAMIIIMQKAIIVENNEINEDMDAEPNSIAKAIWYWISTFNIQTDSLESISNSAQDNLGLHKEEA